MKKNILYILAILSALYGLLVSFAGSGTFFWLIWEAIAAFFILWGILLKKEFFKSHIKLKTIFYSLLAIGLSVLIFLSTMIVSGFTGKEKQNLDCIIVLGAQVYESGPSIVLKHRLDTAAEYLTENPKTQCIVSGGQGSNEPCSEAEAMFIYLTDKGISPDRIVLENTSTSTVENIQNSKAFLSDTSANVGIVTNNFHVFRAVHLAEGQGLTNAEGIAAPSNPLYLPHNILRECCGVMKDWLFGNF